MPIASTPHPISMIKMCPQMKPNVLGEGKMVTPKLNITAPGIIMKARDLGAQDKTPTSSRASASLWKNESKT